ncbi:MAG: sugar phosphate isomerase/epimerase family protein [Candidatus Bathyarchaeia archaeon]
MGSLVGFPSNLFLRLDLERSLEELAVLGAECVELIDDVPHFPHELRWKADLALIKEALSPFEGKVSVHSCFYELNLGSAHSEIRRLTLRETKRCIDLAWRLEAEILTVHPGVSPFPKDMKIHGRVKQQFIQDLRECHIHAESLGIKLCLENCPSPQGFFHRLSEAEELRNRINVLNVTFDVGHAFIVENALGTRNIENRLARDIRRYGKGLISHIHLHDNKGVKDNHLPIGDGAIRFKPIADALISASSPGQAILELWNPKDVKRAAGLSLKRTMRLLGRTRLRQMEP